MLIKRPCAGSRHSCLPATPYRFLSIVPRAAATSAGMVHASDGACARSAGASRARLIGARAGPRRPAELGPAQAGGQPDPVPAPALLHGRLRAADQPRQPAVPRDVGAGADAADVGRQEHDVRGRPAPRALPDRLGALPRPHVHQGGAPRAPRPCDAPAAGSAAAQVLALC